MDSHTDNKPFRCASKMWPKFVEGFKSQQLLNRHMDIYAGKHILCTVEGCTKAFPTKAYLKEHMNTKHGQPYECQCVLNSCKFTCKSRKMLNDHHKFYCPFNSAGQTIMAMVTSCALLVTFNHGHSHSFK